MKLAIYEDKKQEDTIRKCCEKNEAQYVPLFENRFAILTEKREISYGSEDGGYSQDYNVQTFVNIYQCVKNTLMEKKSFFGNKKSVYYNGELLDNLFFKNVVLFCEKKNIEIDLIRYTSNLDPNGQTEDINNIKNIVNTPAKYKALKLFIHMDGSDIIFDKIGYVDIGADLDFYKDHESLILQIITAGLKD